MLRIIADENIPFAREAFSPFGEVTLVNGRAINRELVRDADVLMVRSVTRVNEGLVAGSRVRFVGSASIGADHIDIPGLERAGITFRHAPGSNAESVVEYVIASLLLLCTQREQSLRGRTVGIVGCGNIGGRLALRLPAFGVNVLLNDPPLALQAEQKGEAHNYIPLALLLEESDVITLHVPLTRYGPYSTRHLIGDAALRRMRPDTWLVNAARGEVTASDALYAALWNGRLGACVLDVWEHEPEPEPNLLARVDIATPHIAGHSFDGKVNGTIMLHHALAQALELQPCWDPSPVVAMGPFDSPHLAPPPHLPEAEWLHELVRQMYDIESDDTRMRQLLELPVAQRADAFHELRKHYPRRRAFSRHQLRSVPIEYERVVREGLCVRP